MFLYCIFGGIAYSSIPNKQHVWNKRHVRPQGRKKIIVMSELATRGTIFQIFNNQHFGNSKQKGLLTSKHHTSIPLNQECRTFLYKKLYIKAVSGLWSL